jgi:predicted RNA-binding protein YlqC (UPF0109 family)
VDTSTAFTELVEYMVKSLVDDPEQVDVQVATKGNSVSVTVSVAESDMGRVIGKGGRVVNSMRTLAQVLAAKQGKRVTLEID